MDTTVLSPEIIKVCNPGLTEFGSGNMLALTSQCLRCTKQATECTICSEFCPAAALKTDNPGRPIFASDCIKCGACVGVCPANALATTSKTVQQINRLALQASLRVSHLVICCARVDALLRLEEMTDSPEAATAALELMASAETSEHLLKLPCLGMLTRELWFSILNEIAVAKLEALSVFLPPGLCAECPANALGCTEQLFGEAISVAEEWSGEQLGIISCAEDLPQEHKANVRAYLNSGLEVDRRKAFTGFFDELRRSWDDNAKVGNKALDEVRLQRERRESFARTRLSADLKKAAPAGRRPIATPTRYILMEALGRNDLCADELRLLVSATNPERCQLCKLCVDVCPVKAREAVEPQPAEAADSAEAVASAAPSRANESQPTDENEPHALQIITNELYCVACSACLQACPNAACSFTEILGSSFLLDEPEPEVTAEAE